MLQVNPNNEPDVLPLLEELRTTLRHGEQTFEMQKSPHPVLLRLTFYEAKLRPLLARWAMFFVRAQVSCSNHPLPWLD